MKTQVCMSRLLSIVMIFMTGLSVSAQELVYETVDYNDTGTYNAMAIDSNGVVHISYYDESKDDLKYAVKNSSGWHVYTIESAGFVGKWSSIALDSKGMPHISYYSSTNKSLKYAFQDNSGWQLVTVDSENDVGLYSSITIDHLDNVHITYYDFTNHNLKYATGSGGQWRIERLSSGGNTGEWASIDVDQNNRPHIVCVYKPSSSENQLVYYYFNGIKWEREVPLVTGSRVIDCAKIKIDPSGNPHITFKSLIGYTASNTKIYYLRKTDEQWVSEVVATIGGSDYWISLSLNRTGNPYIAYSYSTSKNFFGIFNKNGLFWNDKKIYSNRDDHFIRDISISLNLYDQVHCSCYDRKSKSLVLFRPGDYGPAEFSLTEPKNGVWTVNQPTFFWQPSSYLGKGLTRYEIQIDGIIHNANIPPSRCFYKLESPISDGWHTWRIKAVTSGGNEIWATETWSFRIDATPPASFHLTVPANGEWLAMRRPTFSWAPSSDFGSSIDHYEIFVDDLVAKDKILQGNSGSIDFDLSDGPHQWHVKAFDAAGNSRQSLETWFVNIDKTAPESFNLVAPMQEFFTNNTTPSFTWEATLDKGIGLKEYQLLIGVISGTYTTFNCSKDSIQYTFKSTEKLSHGRYDWYVKAIDKLGNSRASAHRTIIVDLVQPATFNLQLPPDSGFIAFPTPEFAWTPSTDDVSGISHYELWIDNKISVSNLKVTKTAPSSPLSEGKHQWFVRAIDVAGNTRDSMIRTFFCEWSQPLPFDLISPRESSIVKADSVYFQWHSSMDYGTGLAGYQLWIDGVINKDNLSPADTITTPTHQLEIGEHSWYVVAVDRAGNILQSASILKFSVTYKTGIIASTSIIIPEEFKIHQNYPNPFNPTTTICFDVPFLSTVEIRIFNLNGQLVKRLASGERPPGRFELKWDGKNDQGGVLTSGIYMCQMIAKDYIDIIKISFIK